jgi:hypothetical protein
MTWYTSTLRPIADCGYPPRLKITQITLRSSDPAFRFGRVTFDQEPTEQEISHFDLQVVDAPVAPVRVIETGNRVTTN